MLNDAETKNLLSRHFDLVILDGAFPECALAMVHTYNVPFMYMNTVGFYTGSLSLAGNPSLYSTTPVFFSSFTDDMNLYQRMMNTIFTMFAYSVHRVRLYSRIYKKNNRNKAKLISEKYLWVFQYTIFCQCRIQNISTLNINFLLVNKKNKIIQNNQLKMLDVYMRFRRNSFQIVENFQFVTILYFGWFDNKRWVLSLDDAHLVFFLLFSFRFDVKIDWKMASFSFEFYNRNDVNVASITCKNMYFSRNFKAEATQLWHIFLLFFFN